MTRGRIKRILLPYLLRHTLFGLIGASVLFILFLMIRLMSTLTQEINRMSDHQHQLSTEQGKLLVELLLLEATHLSG